MHRSLIYRPVERGKAKDINSSQRAVLAPIGYSFEGQPIQNIFLPALYHKYPREGRVGNILGQLSVLIRLARAKFYP